MAATAPSLYVSDQRKSERESLIRLPDVFQRAARLGPTGHNKTARDKGHCRIKGGDFSSSIVIHLRGERKISVRSLPTFDHDHKNLLSSSMSSTDISR